MCEILGETPAVILGKKSEEFLVKKFEKKNTWKPSCFFKKIFEILMGEYYGEYIEKNSN